jgi:hypothetical protein
MFSNFSSFFHDNWRIAAQQPPMIRCNDNGGSQAAVLKYIAEFSEAPKSGLQVDHVPF